MKNLLLQEAPRLKNFRAAASSSSPNSTSEIHATASMMKICVHDAQKYSGALTDNFERNRKLFEEHCGQCGLSREDDPRDFSIILCSIALAYYFAYVYH